MMRSIAQEVAPFRIRVNSICPGAIQTPINRSAWDTPQADEALMTLIPIKRIGEPADIGRTAVHGKHCRYTPTGYHHVRAPAASP